MTRFIPSRFSIDSQILELLESIARKQGEINARKGDIESENQIETVATIDAIHYSTKLEGNSLSRDQVTEALKSTKKLSGNSRDLKEILNYSSVRRSLKLWSDKNKPFNKEWILTHHADLLKGILSGRLRGHYRNASCVIKDTQSGRIIYMAPQWEDIDRLMHGLLQWLQRGRLAPTSSILLAAQFHFEFVTIHPFMDGNGRMARLLTNSILRSGGYDIDRYAALEKQHEINRGAYYRELSRLQAGNYYEIPESQDIASWMMYWLQCLGKTYDEALKRIQSTAPLISSRSSLSTPLHLSDRLKRGASLFRKYRRLRASDYGDLIGLARTQALEDLYELQRQKIIKRVGGGRSTVYQIIE